MNAIEVNALRARYKQRTVAGHKQPNADALLRLLQAVERQAAIIAWISIMLPPSRRARISEEMRRV